MKLIISALVSVFFAMPVVASPVDDAVSAFNAAISSGEEADQARTARNLINAAIANPDADASTLIAFEGAWTLCRIDACNGAARGAEFAASRPATGAHPLMADRQLLAALANWSEDDSRRTRNRLNDALKSVAPRRATRLSATAYERRYESRMTKERYESAAVAANSAIEHLEPSKDSLPEQYVRARTAAIIATFYDDAELEHLEAMTRLTGELGEQMLEAATRGAPPVWLQDAYWRADAWRLVMETSFTRRRDTERAEEIATLLDDYRSPLSIWTPSSARPLCDGTFDMTPPIEYPRDAIRQGRYGAVLLGFDISNGRVLNARVLAAVPSETFRTQALQTIRQWRWQAEAGSENGSCSMSRENVTVPIVFRIR
ncbi:MAG: energy transducer TonB [Pseudomonadota bacterium]